MIESGKENEAGEQHINIKRAHVKYCFCYFSAGAVYNGAFALRMH